MATVQIAVDRDFQGTLKHLLERAAHEYLAADRRAEEARDTGTATRAAWRKNAEWCLEVAAQLRRT